LFDDRYTTGQIKKAFRFRAVGKALHPDKGGDKNKFQRLNAAMELLNDPQMMALAEKEEKKRLDKAVQEYIAKHGGIGNMRGMGGMQQQQFNQFGQSMGYNQFGQPIPQQQMFNQFGQPMPVQPQMFNQFGQPVAFNQFGQPVVFPTATATAGSPRSPTATAATATAVPTATATATATASAPVPAPATATATATAVPTGTPVPPGGANPAQPSATAVPVAAQATPVLPTTDAVPVATTGDANASFEMPLPDISDMSAVFKGDDLDLPNPAAQGAGDESSGFDTSTSSDEDNNAPKPRRRGNSTIGIESLNETPFVGTSINTTSPRRAVPTLDLSDSDDEGAAAGSAAQSKKNRFLSLTSSDEEDARSEAKSKLPAFNTDSDSSDDEVGGAIPKPVAVSQAGRSLLAGVAGKKKVLPHLMLSDSDNDDSSDDSADEFKLPDRSSKQKKKLPSFSVLDLDSDDSSDDE